MYKVIACGIFKPYIEHLTIDLSHFDIVYLEIQQHDHPQRLAKNIQKEINQTDKHYKKIIILYGLCGGALLKLYTLHIPLILVKVHDCMSILLGSKEKYNMLTKDNKSLSWNCYSLKVSHHQQTLQQWELLYDEETVAYLKEMLFTEQSLYLTCHLEEEKDFEKEEDDIVEGHLDFLKNILLCQSQHLLELKAHQRISLSLDDEVIKITNDNEEVNI